MENVRVWGVGGTNTQKKEITTFPFRSGTGEWFSGAASFCCAYRHTCSQNNLNVVSTTKLACLQMTHVNNGFCVQYHFHLFVQSCSNHGSCTCSQSTGFCTSVDSLWLAEVSRLHSLQRDQEDWLSGANIKNKKQPNAKSHHKKKTNRVDLVLPVFLTLRPECEFQMPPQNLAPPCWAFPPDHADEPGEWGSKPKAIMLLLTMFWISPGVCHKHNKSWQIMVVVVTLIPASMWGPFMYSYISTLISRLRPFAEPGKTPLKIKQSITEESTIITGMSSPAPVAM